MIRVYITNNTEQTKFEHASGQLEFGRGPKRDVPRCVIQDPFVSKDQLRIEELTEGQLRLENLSGKNTIRVNDAILGFGASRSVPLPVRLSVGDTLIDIEVAQTEEAIPRDMLHTVAGPVRRFRPTAVPSLMELGDSPSPEKLAQWFETFVAVQRAAANSAEFYQQTARAVVELVGLDCGLVLLRRGDPGSHAF